MIGTEARRGAARDYASVRCTAPGRNGWVKGRHAYPAKKPIADYFHANFHVTVSGNFSTTALLATMSVVGAGRIMFATDWPFENIDHAADWFDWPPIAPADRLRIGRTNAVELFKLDKHPAG